MKPTGTTEPFPFHNHRTFAEVREDHLRACRDYRARFAQSAGALERERERVDELLKQLGGYGRGF